MDPVRVLEAAKAHEDAVTNHAKIAQRCKVLKVALGEARIERQEAADELQYRREELLVAYQEPHFAFPDFHNRAEARLHDNVPSSVGERPPFTPFYAGLSDDLMERWR